MLREEKFYYGFDEKIVITESKNKIAVQFSSHLSREIITDKIKIASPDLQFEWRCNAVFIESKDGKESLMQAYRQMPEVKSAQPVFKLNTGLEIGLNNEIVLKFKPDITAQQKEGIEKKYALREVKDTKIYTLYQLAAGVDPLQVANEIQETGLTSFSHPKFIVSAEKFQIVPNDTYFTNQFYLNNTGQIFTDGHSGSTDADIDAPEAWRYTQGDNSIIIAVIDDGVSSNHPDLPNSRQVRLSGSNFADGDPNDPSPQNNYNHGNSCAGIIVGTANNNQGIAGIAPNCKIMPIRIFDSVGWGIAPEDVADAIEFAADNGAKIISNSWGYNNMSPIGAPEISVAVQYAVDAGCVVVFSVGNWARHTVNDNGFVSFPANVNIPSVLTVGASDRYDRQADYSPTANPGSANNQIIDVTAPSNRAYPPSYYVNTPGGGGIAGETLEIWTIDISGNAGDNPWPQFRSPGIPNLSIPPALGEILPNNGINFLSYTARFGGTSAASPQVAATAALILSIYPNMTPQQIFNIITSSADPVGPYSYNRAGVSNELGHGRLNACKALEKAVSMRATFNAANRICDSNAALSVGNIPQGTDISWTASPAYLFSVDSGTGTSFTTAPSNNATYGSGTITATILSACGGPSKVFNRTVWVESNNFSPEIYQPDAACANEEVTFKYPPANAQNYEWSVTAGTIISGRYSHTMKMLAPAGGAVIQLDIYSACFNNLSSFAFLEYGAGCGGFFSVSPNPSDGYFEVTYQSFYEGETANEALLKATDVNIIDVPNYDLILYNNQQEEVFTRKGFNSSKSRIDTGNLPSGIYLLHIVADQIHEVKKLIIK